MDRERFQCIATGFLATDCIFYIESGLHTNKVDPSEICLIDLPPPNCLCSDKRTVLYDKESGEGYKSVSPRHQNSDTSWDVVN